MGSKCSCCLFTQQASSDSDSISKRSDIAVNGEVNHFAAIKKVEKKITKNTQIQLKRQQSRYFQKNKAFQPLSANKKTPLLSPDKKKVTKKKIGEEHSSYYNRIKSKIKPQINGLRHNDEKFSSTSSTGQYYRDVQYSQDQHSQNQHNSNEVSFKFQANQQNLSFQYPSAPMLLQHGYRTQKNKELRVTKKSSEEIQKLCSLAQSTTQPSQLLDCYTQLAYYKFQQKDLESSQSYLTKALNLINADENLDNTKSQKLAQRFKLYVLAGSVYVLKGKASNALDYLLKALKLEITYNGSQSMKLIECYYWLGQASIKISKYTQSKDYFTKAHRLYNRHKVSQPKLMALICLKLGNAYNKQEQYAEADRFYCRGLKQAQISLDMGLYIQIMIKIAENNFDMDDYQVSLSKYKIIFQMISKFDWQNEVIIDTLQKSFKGVVNRLQKMKLPLDQLKELTKLCQEICPQLEQISSLKVKTDQ